MPLRAQAILDNIPAHVLRMGADRRFQYVNQAMALHIGRPAEEIVGRTFAELGASPDVADALWGMAEGAFTNGMPVEFEHRGAFGDGTRWLLTRVIPEPDDTGVVRSALAVTTDVTDIKRAEDALRASEERFRLATAAAGVGIWEWNVRTDQIFWNAEMFQLYHAPPTPTGLVPYATWSGAVVPEDLAEQEAVLRETVRRRGNSARAFRIRVTGDEVRHIEATESVRTNAAGEVE